MALPSLDLIETAFGQLVDHPIWASARSYTGAGTAKAPLNARTGEMAKTNDPATWSTLGEVLSFNRKNFGGAGAIGLMAGPHPILNPEGAAHRPHITALDLDNCVRNGMPLDWVLQYLKHIMGETYLEYSGSMTGVHGFGIVDSLPSDFFEPGTYGTKIDLPTAEKADPNGKTPGVELYCAKRFMLLTGHLMGEARPVRNITGKIPLILPRKRAETLPSTALPMPASDPDGDIGIADVDAAYRAGITVEQRNHVERLLAEHADLREAMLGEKWLDRSAALFASADLAKGYGFTLEQYVGTIMVSTGAAAGHLNDQKDPLRAIARAWNRSPQPERMASVPAADPAGDIGYGEVVDAPSASTARHLDLLTEKNPLGAPMLLPENLLSMELPRKKFILRNLFPAAPIVLAGAGGQGKSALTMALSVMGMLGTKVWGNDWDDLGRVVYCTKEDEYDEIKGRMQDILHAMNVTQRQYHEIRNRFLIEDQTGLGARLVVADRNGGMLRSEFVELMVDKYRNLDVGFMIFDPLNQFGPGESHGNDGAAAVLETGWHLSRHLRAPLDSDRPSAKTTTMFISHMSIASARDEVDDLHAGRSAAALGDNARAVFVLHRHKVENPRGHVAPPDITREAIDDGRVMRLHVAKQSYAKRTEVPFYIERDGWAFTLHAPMTMAETQQIQAARPTPAQARKVDEFEDMKARLRAIILTRKGPFTEKDIKPLISATFPQGHTRAASALAGEISILVDEGKLRRQGAAFSVIRPDVSF